MSMELSKAEKARLEKRDVIDMLELDIRELEARRELCRLKAELVGRDTRSLRTIFIDEMKDAIDEKNGNILELKELASAIEEVLGDEVPDLPTRIDEMVNPSIDEMIDCLDKGVIELLNRRNARIDKLESALTSIRQEHTAMQNTLAEVDRDRTEWVQKTFDAQRMIDSVKRDTFVDTCAAKVQRVHEIVEKKATTDEKDWTLAELLETISAIKSVLDRGVFD